MLRRNSCSQRRSSFHSSRIRWSQLQPGKGNKTRRMEQRRLSLPLVGISQDLDNRGVSGEIL